MNAFFNRPYKPESPIARTALFEIGEFHASAGSRNFRTLASPFDRPHFVFPSSPVVIESDVGHRFVADRIFAVVYPANLHYRRFALSSKGDHCFWVAPTVSLLSSDTELGEACRRLARRETEPFRIPISNRMFLEQRTILHELIRGMKVQCLEIRMLRICETLVRSHPMCSEHALAAQIDEILAENYMKKTALDHLASATGVTVEYLCRVYRKSSGTTIHQRIIQLRTRDAVERILEGEPNLMRLALELGFSSHSHLSTSLRATFGSSPSAIRAMAV